MSKKVEHYLRFDGEGERTVQGVGVFRKDLPPLPVTESVANQYKTDEMKGMGWKVTVKTVGGKKKPARASKPAPKPASTSVSE